MPRKIKRKRCMNFTVCRTMVLASPMIIFCLNCREPAAWALLQYEHLWPSKPYETA